MWGYYVIVLSDQCIGADRDIVTLTVSNGVMGMKQIYNFIERELSKGTSLDEIHSSCLQIFGKHPSTSREQIVESIKLVVVRLELNDFFISKHMVTRGSVSPMLSHILVLVVAMQPRHPIDCLRAET